MRNQVQRYFRRLPDDLPLAVNAVPEFAKWVSRAGHHPGKIDVRFGDPDTVKRETSMISAWTFRRLEWAAKWPDQWLPHIMEQLLFLLNRQRAESFVIPDGVWINRIAFSVFVSNEAEHAYSPEMLYIRCMEMIAIPEGVLARWPAGVSTEPVTRIMPPPPDPRSSAGRDSQPERMARQP
jgi:hypothetical protein